MSQKLMVVIPCYNEEEVLPETSRRLILKMKALIEKGACDETSRVLFVDDGSKDKTCILQTIFSERRSSAILGLSFSVSSGKAVSANTTGRTPSVQQKISCPLLRYHADDRRNNGCSPRKAQA